MDDTDDLEAPISAYRQTPIAHTSAIHGIATSPSQLPPLAHHQTPAAHTSATRCVALLSSQLPPLAPHQTPATRSVDLPSSQLPPSAPYQTPITHASGTQNVASPPSQPPPAVASGTIPDNADPSQLYSYPPAVRNIIEHTKQFSHCDLASINSFPLHPQFNDRAIEYMNEAIAERRN